MSCTIRVHDGTSPPEIPALCCTNGDFVSYRILFFTKILPAPFLEDLDELYNHLYWIPLACLVDRIEVHTFIHVHRHWWWQVFFQTHTTWAGINYQLFFMCVKLLILDTSNFQHIILEEWLWVSRSLLLYFYNYSWNAFVWFNERERRKEFQSSYHLLF